MDQVCVMPVGSETTFDELHQTFDEAGEIGHEAPAPAVSGSVSRCAVDGGTEKVDFHEPDKRSLSLRKPARTFSSGGPKEKRTQ